ncbi:MULTISPECIES: glutamate 5-kinase [Desulfococcus]|jgi:glutamate 5-kinase|uniref:Glutamate 5-kinase n=1 Tax=Desulfococcus multivorans DSM 2059 TaxID=1121405 RepID=S7TDT4_DESML|nr:glutamate 5-kinase [Desulfococcus multivorans]AOY58203.1 ProB: glutamate 5-kinase (gamma-glutamyl kinase) [Desulfococcus multivorans]AQV00551.1 glutamate 5-kinase [Desulfococcus multivorans]EPR34841.1 Glutamate 5-kinase [Desulfococcus multivorans DSM 2059]MDX9818698.1 glutamate 5-kinase [Desulfococcus multivorans]SJZ96402.1 glutamate 5-kinase [Desulfococcus multivorans DSM 2059]
MKDNRRSCFKTARRIVVKVGSNLLTKDNGLNVDFVHAISRQICIMIDRGLQVVLVSSGSMAAGLRKLGLAKRPEEIPKRQAVSAVGQASLIMEYEKAFEACGKKVAQVLLTSDGLYQRKRYLNARNTVHTLLSWHIVPIINENDTVSIEEIKFGDNDTLSAMIALLVNADILINLTDIDGLYNKDPRTNIDAELIPVVSTIKKDIERYASDIPGALGTGGMMTKIRAARKVNTAGIPMIIAQGTKPDILIRLLEGEPHGTYFAPKSHKMTNRKCWIGFTTKPRGVIRIDDGAAKAITQNGKSLLPAGIVDVIGEFGAGSPVEFTNGGGEVLGTGLVNYSAEDIRKIMGLKTSEIKRKLGEKPYDEIIHRDNLTVVWECD